MKDSNHEELEVLDEVDPLGDVSTPFDDVFKSGIENGGSSKDKEDLDGGNILNDNCSKKISGLRIRNDLFLKHLHDSIIEEQNKSKLESSIVMPNKKNYSVITIDTSDAIENVSDKNVTKGKNSILDNSVDNKISTVKTLRDVRHSRENSLSKDESDSKSTQSENSSSKKSVSPDREEIVVEDSETSESESEESEEEEDEDSDEAKEKWEKRNDVEYTEKEDKYYNRNKDRFLKQMKGNMTACTACCNNICHYVKSEIYTHPVLGVLVCKRCSKFYGKGDFKKDCDGLDEYCRWCSNGGDLLVCDHCTNGFCKNCIKRNLGRSALKEITDSKDWKCFVCFPKPLLEARTLHRTILEGIRSESSRKRKTSKGQDDDDSPKEKRKYIQPDSTKTKKNPIKSDFPKKKTPDSSKKKNSDSFKKKDPDSPKVKGSTHGEDLRILLITFKNQLKNIESRTKTKRDEESNTKFHRRLVRLIDLMQDNFSQVKKEIVKQFGNIVENTAIKISKIEDSDNVNKNEKEKNKTNTEEEEIGMESIATKLDSEDKNKTAETKRKRNIDDVDDDDDNVPKKRMKVQNEEQTPNIETKNDLNGRTENQEEVSESLKKSIIKDKSTLDEDDIKNSREKDVAETEEKTESKKSGEDVTFDDVHDNRPIANPSRSKVGSVVNKDGQNHCSTPINKKITLPNLPESPIARNNKRRRDSSEDREVEKSRNFSKVYDKEKSNKKNRGDSEDDDKEKSNEKNRSDSKDEREKESKEKKRDSKDKDKEESDKQRGKDAKTDKKGNKEKSREDSISNKTKEKNIETDEENLPDLFNLSNDNSKDNDSAKNKNKTIKKSNKSEKMLKKAKITENDEEEEESEPTKTPKITRSLRLSPQRSNSARKSNRNTPVLIIDSDSDSDSNDSDNSKNKKKIKPNQNKGMKPSERNLIKNKSTEQSNRNNNENSRKTRSLPNKANKRKR